MSLFRRLVLIAFIALLAGCTAMQGFSLRPYRMNIQQGNFLDAKDVQQVEVGMTQSQVRFLIGSPMVADPFNADRWDYVFFFKVGRSREEIRSNMTIWFEDGRVARIERPEAFDEDQLPDDVGFDT